MLAFTLWLAVAIHSAHGSDRSNEIASGGRCLPTNPQTLRRNSVKGNTGEALKILKRSWITHRLVAIVAEILLTERLSQDVEFVTPTWGTADDYEQLHLGNVDANFEVWPAGKELQQSKFVGGDHGSGDAYDAGIHGLPNLDGLFVPKYATSDSSPAFYSMFEDTEVLEDFSAIALNQGDATGDPGNECVRTEWNCSGDFIWRPSYCTTLHDGQSSCKTQVMKPLEFSQGIYEQQVKNNQLNISFAYMPMSSVDRLVWKAYAKKQKFVFYSYTPREPVDGILMSEFRHLKFPPCTGNRFTGPSDPTGALGCSWGDSSLTKVVSPRFKDQPDAKAFAEKFQLDAADYDRLLLTWQRVANRPNADRTAACLWLQEMGEQKWGDWVQHTQLMSIDSCDCWDDLGIMIGLAFLGVLTYTLYKYRAAFKCCRRTEHKLDPHHVHQSASSVQATDAVELTGELYFLMHSRSNELFSLAEQDERAVPPILCGEPFRVTMHKPKFIVIIKYILKSTIAEVFFQSVIVALIGGAIGALVHMNHEVAVANMGILPNAVALMDKWGIGLAGLYSSFTFLPVMLLSGEFYRAISTWLAYVDMSYYLWGAVENLAILCTAGVQGAGVSVHISSSAPHDPARILSRRAIMFDFYRYINVFHYLTYYQLDHRIHGTASQIAEKLVNVGLVTLEEAQQLSQSPKRMKHEVLSWICTLWKHTTEAGGISDMATNAFTQQVTDLRNRSIIWVEAPPNMGIAMMKINVLALMAFMLASFPFRMYNEEFRCVQPFVMAAVFCTTFCYLGMVSVINTLAQAPYAPGSDSVNIDVFLCEAELTTYRLMRAGYAAVGARPKAKVEAIEDDARADAAVTCKV